MHEMSQQGDNIRYTTGGHFMYDPVILGHQTHEQLPHFVAIHKSVLSPLVIAPLGCSKEDKAPSPATTLALFLK